MHIPDNYLSPSTCIAMGAAMVPIWTVAGKKVKTEISKVKMPLLGIGASFSFLIMMFNIPLPGGTTGHAIGAALLAVLIGPFAACISLTAALLIQALLFGDGGILAFGANCFNIAFVAPFSGYFIYRFIKERIKTEKGEYLALVIASYMSINMAALFTAIEFGIQPLLFISPEGLPLYSPYPLSISIPAMMIPHILILGFVEGFFTVTVFSFIKKVSPGTIYEGAKSKTKAVYGLILALVILSPLGLLTKGTAWGEWSKDEIMKLNIGGKALGSLPQGMEKGFNISTLIPDYAIKGLPEESAYILSAIAAVAIIIISFKVIGSLKKDKTYNNLE